MSQLATEVEENPHLTCGHDATSQNFVPTTFNQHCLLFTKYPSVIDSLCNHKEMATRRADSETLACTCSLLCLYLATLPTHADHIALDGDTSHFDCQPLTSIATGSLQNKIFPPRKEIFKLLTTAFDIWHRKNALLSVPHSNVARLYGMNAGHSTQTNSPPTSLTETSSSSTTLSLVLFSAMKTNEQYHFGSTAHDDTFRA